MFNPFFDALLEKSQSPDLRDEIAFFRSRFNQPIHGPRQNGKYHKVIQRAFTRIGNVARDIGEMQVCEMAREMREEIGAYVDEST